MIDRSPIISSRLRFSFGLTTLIVLTAIVAGYISYLMALESAAKDQDEQLSQMASLLNSQDVEIHSRQDKATLSDEYIDYPIFSQTLNIWRKLQPGEPYLPENLPDGFQTLEITGILWRVLVKNLDSGVRVALCQQIVAIEPQIKDSVIRAVAPIFILLPLMLFFLSYHIKNILIPISIIAKDIDVHSGSEVNPIVEANYPDEVKPFVYSVNQLLRRVADAVNVQRRFVADAAHELRSSLAAVMLQAESLDSYELPSATRPKINALKLRIKRAADLQSQLLTLARIGNADALKTQRVYVLPIFKQVIEDMAPLAEEKEIDIGVTDYENFSLKISETDLFVLVKNLVDNALRYTPEHGKIDLRAFHKNSKYVIEVSDNGPGIQESERQKVFDPFYRVPRQDLPGSGLGLSIVKNIATHAQATVLIRYTDEIAKAGLTISVIFPVIPKMKATHVNACVNG